MGSGQIETVSMMILIVLLLMLAKFSKVESLWSAMSPPQAEEKTNSMEVSNIYRYYYDTEQVTR
jgi:hypothetical protein